MDRRVYIIIAFFLLFAWILHADKKEKLPKNKVSNIPSYVSDAKAYAIMRKLSKTAQIQYDSLESYNASIYIVGQSKTLKKNLLFKFLPHRHFSHERKKETSQFQMLSSISYNSPRFFEQKIHAYNGSTKITKPKLKEISQIISGNLLTSTYFKEEIILPISENTFKYYTFQIIETNIVDDNIYQTISIKPRYRNSKLINGKIIVNTDTNRIVKVSIQGYIGYGFFKATFDINPKETLIGLPTKADVTYEYSILGNRFRNQYTVYFQYDSIQFINKKEIKKKSKLDLSSSFYIDKDTVPIVYDSLFWAQTSSKFKQPSYLKVYQVDKEKPKSTPKNEAIIEKTLDVTSNLFKEHRFSNESVYFRYYGLLNPLLLRYSMKDGFSFRQRIRIRKDFKDQTYLSINPEAGYLFKHKELFYKIKGNWAFAPSKMGYVGFEFGNSYRNYSSTILEEINNEKKKTKAKFDIKDLDINYYDDKYFNLNAQIEVANGVLLKPSLTYHHREPSKKTKRIEVPDKIEELALKKFIDVVPSIGISYTPMQYYAINNNEKRYIRSNYPTFSIEWAMGAPNIFNASSDYQRIEFDIEQMINLGISKKFSYHFSTGSFINQKSTYFASFKYFKKRYFPSSWDDDLGGSFQLLDQEWFNASSYYAQAFFMFESPFLLLPYLKSTSRFILKERFYFATMTSKALPHYSEAGYGIGNQYFDIGAFFSFMKGKFNEFGIKISFGN